MSHSPQEIISLAIETSSRQGSISLGRGDQLLQTVELPGQQRHAIALMPAIDDLIGRHSMQPSSIDEIYVSLGPGSFTGMRIGLTIAKMLGRLLGAGLVGVPTLPVVAMNIPPAAGQWLAVCLNAKRGQMFTGIFQSSEDDSCGWLSVGSPALLKPSEMLQAAGRPLWIIGDTLPDFDLPEQVEILSPMLAIPSSRYVWQIGRRMAREGRFTDPVALLPQYIRLPEAEELWQARQPGAQAL